MLTLRWKSQVLTALSVALLVDLELLSCRSCSISSSVLVWNRLVWKLPWLRKKIICLTRLANKFAVVSKVHDLITCESKVQVVVALGRHEVLTNDTWHVLLQSENVFELVGVTTIYYMAKPVLGKSLCSDWFFLGQDFAVRTVSMETFQSVYFCFGAKAANSKFATKVAKKKCEYCHSSRWNYQKKLKRLKFFRNFNDECRRRTFLNASHRECILLSETECHIINNLLT